MFPMAINRKRVGIFALIFHFEIVKTVNRPAYVNKGDKNKLK